MMPDQHHVKGFIHHAPNGNARHSYDCRSCGERLEFSHGYMSAGIARIRLQEHFLACRSQCFLCRKPRHPDELIAVTPHSRRRVCLTCIGNLAESAATTKSKSGGRIAA